ncbi:MAG: efflux RND transporter periplasmic adaptor subunit [Fidelibacterota bacterium]
MKKGILLLLLILISCSRDGHEAVTTVPKIPEIPVAVALLQPSTYVEALNVIGKTEAIRRGNLIFEVPGKVEKIFVEENDFVRADEPLARINQEQYDAAFRLAETAVNKARNDYASAKSLYESNVISKEQYDGARLGLDQAESAFIKAREALNNTVLKAPFDGYIISRNLEIGDVVSPAAGMGPPFIVADMSEIKIVVSIPESRIGYVKKSQPVEISIKSLPNQIFRGDVYRVGLVTDQFTNSYDVEIHLENSNQLIKIGMVAEVKIILNVWEKVKVIPLSLIHEDKDGQFIYVVHEGKAKRKAIQINAFNGIEAFIDTEVSIGDSLITRGHHDVRDGSPVNIITGVNQ